MKMNKHPFTPPIKQNKLFLELLTLLLVAFPVIASCSVIKEDASYLTQIPQATILAYRSDMPITSKLDAAIDAQAFVQTSRIEYEDLPRVILVEKSSLDEAYRKLSQFREGNDVALDRPGKTEVWLVILEGDWRIVPPVPDRVYTPEPLSPGCLFVIIDPVNSRREMGTMTCPD